MKRLTLALSAMVWMTLPAVTHAQDMQAHDMQARIDELAAGMDEFAPAVEELPLDLIADDFDLPQGDAAGTTTDGLAAAPLATPDIAPSPDPTGPVTTVTVIPEGWQKYSLLGLSFAAPADWQLMTKPDDGDELGVGYMNMAEKRVIAARIAHQFPGNVEDFEEEMEDLPKSAAKDLGVDLADAQQEVSYPDPIVALDGLRLLRKKFVLRKDDFFVYAEMFYKEDFDERGGTDALFLMSLNLPEAEAAPILRQMAGTVGLDAAPLPEAQTALNGLVNYEMPPPKGWKRQVIGPEALTFITSPIFSAGLSVETGYRAQEGWDDEGDFETTPEMSRGEIFGQPATIRKGRMREAYMQVGMRFVKGLRRDYLLDMCLANGDRILVSQSAAEAWLDGTGYDSLLETISLTLPPDAILCAAPATASVRPPRPDPSPDPSPKAGPVVTGPVVTGPVTEPVAPAVSATGWTVYTNARFGTSMRYPTSHFQLVGPPPANGDGHSFSSSDGLAQMNVWAGYNALDQSAVQIMDDLRSGFPGARVIAQQLGADSFMIVLQDGPEMVHQRSMIDGESVVHNIRVHYPAAQEAFYGAVAQAMRDSLAAPMSGPAAGPVSDPVARLPPTPVGPDTPAGMEDAFWSSIERSPHAADFQAYLDQFPNGSYAAQARQRLSELTAPVQSDPQMELAFWQSIQTSSDPAMYQAYLDRWPNGTFAVLARLNLQRLSAPVLSNPVPAYPVPPDPAPVITPSPTLRSGIYYTPERNTAERSALMDAAREPMQRALRQSVIFLVKTLRTDGEWAFLMAEPLQPNGQKLDWYSTPYANDWRNDAMSDVVMVLMHRQPGGWQVIDYIIGLTDVYWYNWIGGYGLPERLFTAG